MSSLHEIIELCSAHWEIMQMELPRYMHIPYVRRTIASDLEYVKGKMRAYSVVKKTVLWSERKK